MTATGVQNEDGPGQGGVSSCSVWQIIAQVFRVRHRAGGRAAGLSKVEEILVFAQLGAEQSLLCWREKEKGGEG